MQSSKWFKSACTIFGAECSKQSDVAVAGWCRRQVEGKLKVRGRGRGKGKKGGVSYWYIASGDCRYDIHK